MIRRNDKDTVRVSSRFKPSISTNNNMNHKRGQSFDSQNRVLLDIGSDDDTLSFTEWQTFPEMSNNMSCSSSSCSSDNDNCTSKLSKISEVKVENKFLQRENQHLRKEMNLLEKKMCSMLESFVENMTNNNNENLKQPIATDDSVMKDKDTINKLLVENNKMQDAIHALSKLTLNQSTQIAHYKSHYKRKLHQVKLELNVFKEKVPKLEEKCMQWRDSYMEERRGCNVAEIKLQTILDQLQKNQHYQTSDNTTKEKILDALDTTPTAYESSKSTSIRMKNKKNIALLESQIKHVKIYLQKSIRAYDQWENISGNTNGIDNRKQIVSLSP